MRALLLTSLIIPSFAFSGELIRCPDWKALFAADRTAALRSAAAPENDFHEALNRTRAPLDATGGASSPAAASCTYTIVAGDTLSRIAAARLGSAARWREIAVLNQSTISSVNALRVGTAIRLPCAGSKVGQGVPHIPVGASALPTPAPIPRWTARKGESFLVAVQRWARAAGYTVVVETNEDWTFAVDVNEEGSFRDVLQRVVRGFAAQGTAPAVQVFSNNVVKIGGL
ncbi:TcpQ domain-containing protein [Cognatiyoonia sp. IB215182]|uniref:TcpQ domain-containing protein n=1 Tax=Cognatiyoonia sp. IB215182 TaxID=3097353 RepID=UPI002A158E38|nr:TcpQ domain-containing protein [Cognatiyoonia sp. IB215182]MDX8355411.1 TcpQ domain-containing protein [Cognatiyoonia sp. IB215182]